MIDDLLTRYSFLNNVVIPSYNTSEGKAIYEQSLRLCTQQFPKYVEELEGMAAGAKVPFHKVNILRLIIHLD